MIVAVGNRTQSNSLLGLALIQTVSLPAALTGMFKFLSDLEGMPEGVSSGSNLTRNVVHAASAGRIKMIADLPAEDAEYNALTTTHANDSKPSGEVIFEQVSLRYSAESALALKQVSFRAMPGRRIGICGRSGSGKSTVIAALFRLVNIESGSIRGVPSTLVFGLC